MHIRPLNILDKTSYENYMASWNNEPLIVPHSTDDSNYDSFEQMLEFYNQCSTNPPENYVPAITCFLFEIDDIVGAVNIRLGLNEWLKQKGGHVGYGISPKYRGNGYAKVLLQYAIDVLKSVQIEQILVTCDETNTASRKTIEALGGEQIEPFVDGNDKTLRFLINAKDR